MSFRNQRKPQDNRPALPEGLMIIAMSDGSRYITAAHQIMTRLGFVTMQTMLFNAGKLGDVARAVMAMTGVKPTFEVVTEVGKNGGDVWILKATFKTETPKAKAKA